MSKCSMCGNSFTEVKLSPVSARSESGKGFKAISYDCPHCETSLSVQIDPIAIKTDIVKGVTARILR
jgi:hypothetical protein